MSGCRVGKIKFKNGPTVHLIEGKGPSKFMEFARSVDETPDNFTGFLILAWEDDLNYRLTYDVSDSKITPSLFPDWVRMIVARQVIENGTVRAVEEEFFM